MKKKWTERLTDPIRNAFDEGYDKNVANARLKWYDHWAKVCGVESWEDIDFQNPVVSLEWKLCDPRTQAKLMSGRRDEVLAEFSEAERQVYLTCKDLSGTPYTNIENERMAKAIGKAFKIVGKR